MKVADLIPPKHRPAVFMRRIATCRLQRWMLSLGVELRTRLLESLGGAKGSLEEWLEKPSEDVWKFDLSRKGLRLCSPECELCVPPKSTCFWPSAALRNWRAG